LGHVCRGTTWSKKKPQLSPGLKSKEKCRSGAAMIIARRKKGAAEADDGRN